MGRAHADSFLAAERPDAVVVRAPGFSPSPFAQRGVVGELIPTGRRIRLVRHRKRPRWPVSARYWYR
ncbi:hypothetical protein [Saccharopolyspora sp. NPDC050642]|uniref:hypothetical protein n=1 Tax=Saccharopolyspora sp. NPDC050642 TaxID=3157099 RepID=UPI0033F3D429